MIPYTHSNISKMTYKDWSNYLQSQIVTDNADKLTTWYAIIDPSADNNLPDLLCDLNGNSEILPIFMNTMLEEYSLQGPLFVPLKEHSDVVNWFFEKSETKAIGIIYEVENTSVDSFFDHLQNLVECKLPNGKTGVFRFYDPRVLYALTQSEDQSWSHYASGSSLCLHAWEAGRAVPIQVLGENKIMEQEGFLITDDLLNFISKYTAPYTVINNMQGEKGETLRCLPIPESFQFVNSICEDLYSLNIRNISDLIIGISITMQLKYNIFKQTFVQELITAKMPSENLLDVLKKLPDNYFKGIKI
ncbi:DUF4123 domain-containing protein [Desulfovibrio litoralis]|uniref:DUF4123 domain-containing protein n=1 Tax=Desulfovibrio litoralis DSM 11393 TaxID=1121455 RepID=A0A1M7TNY0_9BACT|nr:DUF4123 domain-containing protein [Desulfovibrio litoralis]SHN72415.1 protein of unknown function [Desulfovibrio litoralis DSM 11393]